MVLNFSKVRRYFSLSAAERGRGPGEVVLISQRQNFSVSIPNPHLRSLRDILSAIERGEGNTPIFIKGLDRLCPIPPARI